MKTTAIAAAAIIMAASQAHAAQPCEGSAPISHVTVFAKGAEIVREGTIAPAVNPASQPNIDPNKPLVLEVLPSEFVEGSLHVEVSDGASVNLESLKTKQVECVVKAASANLAKLVQDLTDLQFQKFDLGAEIKELDARRKNLLAVVDRHGKGWPPHGRTVTSDELKAAQELLDNYPLHSVEQRHAVKDSELKAKEKEIEAKKKEIARASAKTEKRTQLAVLLSGTAGPSSGLRVSYRVKEASWQPSYVVRLENIQSAGKTPNKCQSKRSGMQHCNAEVTVERRARVVQQTAEVWPGVMLYLSTDCPVPGLKSPSMAVVKTIAGSPKPGRMFVWDEHCSEGGDIWPFPIPRDEFKSAQPTTVAPNKPVQLARIEETVPAAQQAPSTAQKSQVTPAKGDAAIWTVVAPLADPNGYHQAEFELTGEQVYPPGDAEFFIDGAFIGKADLPLRHAGDLHVAGLGPDPDIIVKREVQPVMADGKVWAAGYAPRLWRFRYTILNRNANRRAYVMLVDRAPLLTSDQYRVSYPHQIGSPDYFDQFDKAKLVPFECPRKLDFGKTKGGVMWGRSIGAGETDEFAFAYAVHPKSKRASMICSSSTGAKSGNY